MNKTLLLLLCSLSLSAIAQKDDEITKLEDEFQRAIEDSNKVNLLNEICGKYYATDTEKAIGYAQQALNLSKTLDYKEGIATSYMGLGTGYWYLGEYDKAIENYLWSLKINEQLGSKRDIASSMMGIGMIYNNQGNYKKAMEYHLKSLRIKEEIGDKKPISQSLTNIGAVYYAQLDYDMAVEYFLMSLTIDKQLGNKKDISSSLNNVAVVYTDKGNYRKAMEYHMESLEIEKELGDKSGTAVSLLNIGLVYKEIKEFPKSIEYLNRSIELSKEVGVKECLKEAYTALAETYADMGDYNKAYEYHRLYSSIKDSILTETSSRQIAEMETKYQTEKKEQELEIKDLQITKQDSDLARQQVMIFSAMGGVVLLIALAFLLFNRNRIKQRANEKLGEAFSVIEQKNKDITDSIEYAKNLQEAILPDMDMIKEALPEHFIFFRPRDIVSGDFYWFHEKTSPFGKGDERSSGGLIFIAACDCTGHGVPGAFVSMMCNNLMNRSVIEHDLNDPAEILKEVSLGVQEAFKKEGSKITANDGMDVSLCVLDKSSREVWFAGAHRPLIVTANGELQEYKGDNRAIGGRTDGDFDFTGHKVKPEKGSNLYIFSDGYADQFGGPKGKKFKYGKFKELLLSLKDKDMAAQDETIQKALNEWQGDHRQVDDICVIGVRV